MAAHCSGCVFTAVRVHFGWVKCRALIPSMGHHTWPYVTSLSLFNSTDFNSVTQNLWISYLENIEKKSIPLSTRILCSTNVFNTASWAANWHIRIISAGSNRKCIITVIIFHNITVLNVLWSNKCSTSFWTVEHVDKYCCLLLCIFYWCI